MKEYQESNQISQFNSWPGRHKLWTAVIIILGILLLTLAVMHFLPVNVENTAASDPALGHDEAAARVVAIRQEEQDSGVVNPVCESILMSHGEITETVIVMFHGFTSCPEQFRELGQQLFDLGYNVYIPLLPHHGHADRDREALLNTSAEELAVFATESLDIAYGLGERRGRIVRRGDHRRVGSAKSCGRGSRRDRRAIPWYRFHPGAAKPHGGACSR
jgi:pimeloyl-ACP methyl ester carboxylesterase